MNEHRRQVEQLFYAALELPPDGRTAFLRDVCGDDQRLFDEVRELLAHDAAANTAMPTVPRPGERWIDRLPPDAGAARPPGDVGSACPPGDFASGRSSLGAGLASSGEPSASHPTQVGAYRILGVIGEGGMGIVYRAEQENPRRTVALKVIRPEFASPQTLRRFEIEASVLARLQHPGVAQVYEAGAAPVSAGGRRAYFAMELVDGRTLLDYANGAGLRTRARLELLAKVCDAVEHAHQKGVIHRDLKPANILVDAEGRPKVLDFGVARATDADMQMTTMQTAVGQLVGTVPYMSPEQVTGDPDQVDTRSDVYALGVILYELLTGRLPYDLSNRTVYDAIRVIREEPPTQISAVRRALRGDIETIVSKALEKDRERRYESAAALAADVRRFLADEPILARPPSAAYQLRKFARRNKALVGGALSVLVALVVGSAGVTVQYVRAERARGQAEAARRAAEARRGEAEQARDAARLAQDGERRERERAQRQERSAQQMNNLLMRMLLLAQPSATLGHELTLREALDAVAADLNGRADRLDPQIAGELRMIVGLTYMRLGDLAAAEPHLTDALERLSADKTARRRADAAIHLAELRARQGRYDEARPLLEVAVGALRVRHGEQSQHVAAALHDHAGLLKQLDRLEEAESLLREVVTMRRALGAPAPLAQSLRALGAVLADRGQLDEAETLMREGVELLRSAPRRSELDVAMAQANLGYVVAARGGHAEAARLLDAAVAIQHEVLPPNHPDRAGALAQRAAARLMAGDAPAAEEDLREALRIREASLPGGHWLIANTRSLLGESLARQGRLAEAEPLLVDSQRRLEQAGAPRQRQQEAIERLVLFCQLSGRDEQAAAWQARLQSLAPRTNAVPTD